jgi:hypothetical protein
VGVGVTPLEKLLEALDALDLDGVVTLLAPDCALLMCDGRRAQGTEDVRAQLGDLLDHLHSTSHRITNQWQVGEMWIAELEADYELRDQSRLSGLPRAIVARAGSDGIAELRVYGAHEHALGDRGGGDGSMVIGGRYMPPL